MNADFETHLNNAVRFHGHLCGGQVLGVRIAMAGLREMGIENSRGDEGRNLVIFTEIDRCVVDAIISVTGRTPGKRSVKVMDYGKMAATFLDTASGKAVRVSMHPGAQEKITALMQPLMPAKNEKSANIEALKIIPEGDLLKIQPVRVAVRPQDLPGESLRSVVCACCGETVRDMRELYRDGKAMCRPCTDKTAYYQPIGESA